PPPHQQPPHFPTRRSSDLAGPQQVLDVLRPRHAADDRGRKEWKRRGHGGTPDGSYSVSRRTERKVKGKTSHPPVNLLSPSSGRRSEEHTSDLQSRSDLVCR